MRIAQHRARCFPPLVAGRPRGVILGSMPGVPSLQRQEYYGNPQNAFWRIMAQVYAMPAGTYPQKLNIIRRNHLALWDVMADCLRTGSEDAKIDKRSVALNDFAGFFKKYPSIRYVFLNGGRAAGEFMGKVLPALPSKIQARIVCIHLPSTSPAHARMRPAEKAAVWASALSLVTADAPVSRKRRAAGG